MSPSRKWTWVGAVLVLAGIALRTRAVELNPSLWLDESSLALNILSRSFGGLLKPLDYSQGAPILFLWLEKMIETSARSSSEFALRLMPLLSGCAACVCFWILCRNLKLSAAGTLCATALFSFSPGLIDYSGQAKQYSTDVFVAIAIYLAAIRFLNDTSLLNILIYGLGGLLAIGVSHPAIFALAGAGTAILIDGWRRSDRRRLAYQSAMIFLWLVGFAFNFYFFLRHLSQIPGMVDYWQDRHSAFMQLSLRAPGWLLDASLDVARMTGFIPWLLLALAFIGWIFLWRLGDHIPVMISLPIVFAIIASALHRYPFADRMTLFAIPTLLICAGSGLSAMFSLPIRSIRLVALALFCILMFAPVKLAGARAVFPKRFGREEFREAFLDAVASGQCVSHILVYERAANHYRYYNRFRWAEKHPAAIVTALDWIKTSSAIFLAFGLFSPIQPIARYFRYRVRYPPMATGRRHQLNVRARAHTFLPSNRGGRAAVSL